jgi:hypothetical protein
MMETPRPLTLGEILDRTAGFYRSRFLVFFGISALPTGVVLVLACGIFVFLAWWGNSGPVRVSAVQAQVLAFTFVGAAVVFAVPAMLTVTALAAAALSRAAHCAYLGEKVSIRGAYRDIWRRTWRYIWLYVLQAGLVYIAPVLAWVGLLFPLRAASHAMIGSGIDEAAGIFAAIWSLIALPLAGYAVWMLLRLSLAFPASVVEQIAPWAAIRRSATLSKGTRGRIFLLYLLGAALGWVLSGGLATAMVLVVAFLPGANDPGRAQKVAMIMLFTYYGAAIAVQALTKPIYGIALVLFYYDQRIRQEGFDIEWMMQRAGLVAAAPATPEPQPAATVTEQPVEQIQSASPNPVDPSGEPV